MKFPSSKVSSALILKGLASAYYSVAPWIFGITLWDILKLPDLLMRIPRPLLYSMAFCILLSFQIPMWKAIFKKPKRRKNKEDKVLEKIDEAPTTQG